MNFRTIISFISVKQQLSSCHCSKILFLHCHEQSHNYFTHLYFLFLDRLPFSIRVLLESAVRNCDNFQVTTKDVEAILDWEKNQTNADGVEVPFKPARVILQVSFYHHRYSQGII